VPAERRRVIRLLSLFNARAPPALLVGVDHLPNHVIVLHLSSGKSYLFFIPLGDFVGEIQNSKFKTSIDVNQCICIKYEKSSTPSLFI
jgi:hypothetical protein